MQTHPMGNIYGSRFFCALFGPSCKLGFLYKNHAGPTKKYKEDQKYWWNKSYDKEEIISIDI